MFRKRNYNNFKKTKNLRLNKTDRDTEVEEGRMSGVSEVSPHGAVSFPVESAVIAASHLITGEEELALRFSKKPYLKQDLVYEFTREPEYIHQYLTLYKSQCIEFLEYKEKEDELNEISHILVVRRGRLVVGGARLLVSTPRVPRQLLMEFTGFNLKKHFPELEQRQLKYAELTRLAMHPDYRGNDTLKHVIYNVYRKCLVLGVDLFFATAKLAAVRSYRQLSKAIGLSESIIHTDIDFPRYPGYEEDKYYVFSTIILKELMPVEGTVIHDPHGNVLA